MSSASAVESAAAGRQAPGVKRVQLYGDDAAVACDEEVDAVGGEVRLDAVFDAVVVIHQFLKNGGLVAQKLLEHVDAEVLGDGCQLALADKPPELPLRPLDNVFVPPAQ